MVAFYGVGILKLDEADRLKSVFEKFLEKKESFDSFGCTNRLLGDEVSRELFAVQREQKKASSEPQSPA